MTMEVVRMMSHKMKTGFGWGQTAGVDFDTYMSVDQELATCGVLCVEEMCGEVGSENSVEEGQSGSGADDD